MVVEAQVSDRKQRLNSYIASLRSMILHHRCKSLDDV